MVVNSNHKEIIHALENNTRVIENNNRLITETKDVLEKQNDIMYNMSGSLKEVNIKMNGHIRLHE